LTRASHVFASRVALVAVTEADVAEAVARAAPISPSSDGEDGEDDGVPDAREEGDPGAVSSAAGPLVLLRLLGSPAFESHAALVELALASLLSCAHREQEGARAARARLAPGGRRGGRQAARRAALGRARAVAAGFRRARERVFF
jgi:hypothetical protein